MADTVPIVVQDNALCLNAALATSPPAVAVQVNVGDPKVREGDDESDDDEDDELAPRVESQGFS